MEWFPLLLSRNRTDNPTQSRGPSRGDNVKLTFSAEAGPEFE